MLRGSPSETVNLKSGITHVGDDFFVSLDGSSCVPIDKQLAQNISLALRAQNKIDRALTTGSNPKFLKIVAMLNCRQTIFAVRNITSLRSLSETSEGLQQPDQPPLDKLDDMEKMIGVPEMIEDINHILKSGRQPVIGSKDNIQIKKYLEIHPDDLPVVVHVFGIQPAHTEQVRSKLAGSYKPSSFEEYEEDLARNHTFIVLGKDSAGKYICFHKQGPEIQDRFELSELSSVLSGAVAPSETYLSFIGPVTLSL